MLPLLLLLLSLLLLYTFIAFACWPHAERTSSAEEALEVDLKLEAIDFSSQVAAIALAVDRPLGGTCTYTYIYTHTADQKG